MAIEEVKAKEVFTYSPQSILNIFNNVLKVPAENNLIRIKGVYQAGRGVQYNGYYYDTLLDEMGEVSMTLRVPAKLRERIVSGQVIEFTGFVSRKLEEKGGQIKIHLNLTDLHQVLKPQFSTEDQEAYDVVKAKVDIGFKDVETFLKKCVFNNQKPNITVITGTTSIIDKDINHALGDALGFFDLDFIRVNLSSIAEIIMAFNQASSADIILVTRGGGSGLEIFNSIELTKKALTLKPYFVTAIGHEHDITLLDKIADKKFSTPSTFGNCLRDIYNRTIQEKEGSLAKLTEDIRTQLSVHYERDIELYKNLSKGLQVELNNLRSKPAGITFKHVIIYIVLAVIIGFTLALLLF